jgi:hypothetical protein
MRPDRAHRSVYLDPRIFKLEMRNIFGRAWVYVGHESLVPRPGDYVTGRMGSQPIVLSRHTDGRTYVYYNTCSHRGATVCTEEKGTQSSFDAPATAGRSPPTAIPARSLHSPGRKSSAGRFWSSLRNNAARLDHSG